MLCEHEMQKTKPYFSEKLSSTETQNILGIVKHAQIFGEQYVYPLKGSFNDIAYLFIILQTIHVKYWSGTGFLKLT